MYYKTVCNDRQFTNDTLNSHDKSVRNKCYEFRINFSNTGSDGNATHLV